MVMIELRNGWQFWLYAVLKGIVTEKLVKKSQEKISTFNLLLTACAGVLRVANQYHIVRCICIYQCSKDL